MSTQAIPYPYLSKPTIKNLVWALILPCMSLAFPLFALEKDIEQPVRLNADAATYDKKAGLSTYNGNVIISQGTMKIQANSVNITAPNNEIQLVKAKGNPVQFEQEMDNGKYVKGTARNINYDVGQKALILTGEAELTQDSDRFSSNRIEYDLASGEMRAGGNTGSEGGRVEAIFYPTNTAQQ